MSENLKSDTGNRLRKVRKDYELTQADVSALTNIPAAQICQWEAGNSFPSVPYLIKWAQLFDGLSISWLVLGHEPKWLKKPVAKIEKPTIKGKKKRFTQTEIDLIIKTWPELPEIDGFFKSQIRNKAHAIGLRLPKSVLKKRRSERAQKYNAAWDNKYGDLRTGMPSPEAGKAKIDQGAARVARSVRNQLGE